jgi:hypothetical protein
MPTTLHALKRQLLPGRNVSPSTRSVYMFSLNLAYLYRSSNQWSETAQGFQTLKMINIVTRLQFLMTICKITPILRKALS